MQKYQPQLDDERWLVKEAEGRLAADAASLSEVEILATLLNSHAKARAVMSAFGGRLGGVLGATQAELHSAGLTESQALRVRAAIECGRRIVSTGGRECPPRLTAPTEVVDYMRETLRGKRQEEFHALLLDTKHGIIRDHCVTVGLVDRSQVHAREVFRPAIREACSKILLVHNHPSGDPTPSDQDVNCTRALVAAGECVGIEILDHVIIGNPDAAGARLWFSFREEWPHALQSKKGE